jgi:hypothetical protein
VGGQGVHRRAVILLHNICYTYRALFRLVPRVQGQYSEVHPSAPRFPQLLLVCLCVCAGAQLSLPCGVHRLPAYSTAALHLPARCAKRCVFCECLSLVG